MLKIKIWLKKKQLFFSHDIFSFCVFGLFQAFKIKAVLVLINTKS